MAAQRDACRLAGSSWIRPMKEKKICADAQKPEKQLRAGGVAGV
jgi:hypothetical protein